MAIKQEPPLPSGQEAIERIKQLGQPIYSDAPAYGMDRNYIPAIPLQDTYQRNKETMYRGAEPIRLMYCLDNDGYFTIQGYNTYRFGMSPENNPVLLHFDDIVYSGIGEYNGPDAERIRPMLPDPENNRFLLYPGYARVTEARQTRTYEPWVDMTAKMCEMDEIDYTVHHGLLYRLSPTVWANDWVKYWSRPLFEGRGADKKPKTNDNGEPLYQLYYYTSGSKQDDPIELDAKNFKKRIGDVMSRLGAFKAGEPKTLKEIRKSVRNDFHIREKIFREGEDPEVFFLNEEYEKGKKQSKRARFGHTARRIALRGAQGMNNFIQRIELEKVKKKGALGVFITGLKLLSKSKRFAVVTSPLFIATLVVSSISYLIARKDSLIVRDRAHLKHRDDISHKFWNSTSNGLENIKHSGLLDPHKGSMIRILKADEADITPPHNFSWYDGSFEEAGWHAIADTTRSRNGSIVEGFEINGCSHYIATEPNGLGVCYVPYMDTEYAIPDMEEALPECLPALSTVQSALDEKPCDDRPIIKVYKNRKGALSAAFLSAAAFEKDVRKLVAPQAEGPRIPTIDNAPFLSQAAWDAHNGIDSDCAKRGLLKWFKRSAKPKQNAPIKPSAVAAEADHRDHGGPV